MVIEPVDDDDDDDWVGRLVLMFGICGSASLYWNGTSVKRDLHCAGCNAGCIMVSERKFLRVTNTFANSSRTHRRKVLRGPDQLLDTFVP